ncbi:hypothetical protein SPI_08254 [Niveomyces insectorum RCEF 264]|uniref:Uncharacterized protein n=1 Tax=Niveomyces insectorum RCEF 264 TaxID=1081102 RepID=A0A162MFY6_9HYPO|nr:hypothetical protein SPI_08254 [Niveomyces insectorum RCEF 264]
MSTFDTSTRPPVAHNNNGPGPDALNALVDALVRIADAVEGMACKEPTPGTTWAPPLVSAAVSVILTAVVTWYFAKYYGKPSTTAEPIPQLEDGRGEGSSNPANLIPPPGNQGGEGPPNPAEPSTAVQGDDATVIGKRSKVLMHQGGRGGGSKSTASALPTRASSRGKK